jgi:hypothetical protein
MTASTLPGLTAERAGDAPPTISPVTPETAAIARIDFAHAANGQFVIYGWILGRTKSVRSASIHFGSIVVDLAKQAFSVRRPDIAQHFSLETTDDEHGFYALIDLPDKFAIVDYLDLSITISSGEKTETHWPVAVLGTVPASVNDPYLMTFHRLLPLLPRAEAKRLIEFALALGLPVGAEHMPLLPPPIGFAIELCCVLQNRVLLVSGWIFDPLKDLTQVQIRVGGSVFNLLDSSVWIPRPDINVDTTLYRRRDTPQNPGFIFVHPIPQPDAEENNVRFALAAGTDIVHMTRQVSHTDARRELLSLLSKMDPQSALALIERLATVVDKSPEQRSLAALLELVCYSGIERLPASIQHSNPRYSLHVDQAIPVADKGLFLIGWFNADPLVSPRVMCHCGFSSFVISDKWFRHFRTDVTSHLASSGIQSTDHRHGFSCYVPLRSGDAPYYLSAALESGDVSRMSVALPPKPPSALQTVRALLTFFDCEHPDLRFLMDSQIGPAVATAWAARNKPARKPVFRSYGARPTDCPASIIVPLYGRYDFAEYQMALFADDPQFQNLELIYVVDDPAIFAEFNGVCADLYGIYRVPFVLAFSGANLGYAGANNFGAEVARGQHLILVNSDVLPKRPGWAGDLLRVYQSLPDAGVVGAKLLYEDGSIQHAGMAFRRYSRWGDLWMNDHPFKGQNPGGLTGVHEVDAVTAACAIIDASLYRELGGLSEDYIIGDFEDSDLCLRASSAGRRNYIALGVELYHLERQSQNRMNDVTWRTNLTLYNCWLHNSRWADVIEKTRDRNSSAYLREVE